MAYTPKRFYTGQPGTSVGALYTAPAATTSIVQCINICNTTSNPATITLHIVPSGGTAGTTNMYQNAVTIRGNDTLEINKPTYLNTGDSISALQGTASALTVNISISRTSPSTKNPDSLAATEEKSPLPRPFKKRPKLAS